MDLEFSLWCNYYACSLNRVIQLSELFRRKGIPVSFKASVGVTDPKQWLNNTRGFQQKSFAPVGQPV